MGRQISRDYGRRRIDAVVTLYRGFVFAADLLRHVSSPVVRHFVREDVRDVQHEGVARCEVFFGARSELKGRDVLLLDVVIDSGVTQGFLLRRLSESKPRSLRLAVLLDKMARRRAALEPDYFGFQTASNLVWVGYRLADLSGAGRNTCSLSAGAPARRSATGAVALSGVGRTRAER